MADPRETGFPLPGSKYRIGTVAKMTGFSVDVLRAWEKRYQLLDPERGPGGQRLYTDEDLAVLRVVSREMRRGRSIGEVALAGRQALLARAHESSEAAPPSPDLLAAARSGIVEAAIELDGDRIQELLDTAFAAISPEVVVAGVIEPAARDIGEAWAAGVCSVAGEHLATAVFVRRLQGLIHAHSRGNGVDRPRAICACLPDELHEVPVLIVAFHLARMGLRVTYLGANLPLEDLESAMRTQSPQGVYLSVSRRAILDVHKPRLLELLRRHSSQVAFVIGGRGIADGDEDLMSAGAVLWPAARPCRDLDREFFLAQRSRRKPS